MTLTRTLIFAVALITVFNVHAESISCRVVGVSDGDTLTCLTEEKRQVKVRLAQIDAPEKGQSFGQKAKQALANHVFGKKVTIEVETTDRYGRTVGTVIFAGHDINREMVTSGMAWVYDQYARDPAYFEAQSAARASHLGLWSEPDPIRPSDWRHGTNLTSREFHGAAYAIASAPAAAMTHGRNEASSGFSCAGKRYCREMNSCAEAQFYLNSCGLYRLDGDRDGLPCEKLC
ncbi:nuclease family protein [Azoarcus sp. CIB]|uniref:thermonuclease family protein n=1 Tax=Aromatoleum sp. (strain CIB) TaxID=198107 RepID=UPI00067DE103|nr:thermonuclease family protein [Azoarcus sp. CIB]AKU11319.1 nuclease family protein [Azoarcus sp. CIB]